MTGVMCIYMGHSRELNACEIYRGNMPLYYLGKQHGWETGYSFYDTIHAGGPRVWQHLMEKTDVFVFPRGFIPDGEAQTMVAEGMYSVFEILRQQGKKVVYEVDDDFTNDHRAVVQGDALTLMGWCDAMTVTTPMLAERMRRRIGRPVYVAPNMIDPAIWKAPRIPVRGYDPEAIVVGLSGSTTHEEDWRVLENVLPTLLDKHPRMQLWLTGFHPDYLRGLPRAWYIGGMPYQEYAEVVKHCDIVLCPVDPEDGFNLSKSPIKAVEGMGAGAAVIATDMPVYRLVVFDGVTGKLTPHTEDGWFRALDRLLSNQTERQELAARGYRYVWKHYDISRGWTHWAKAYHQILKQKQFRPPVPELLKEVLQ